MQALPSTGSHHPIPQDGCRGAPFQAMLGGHHGLNVVILSRGKPRLFGEFASLASGQGFNCLHGEKQFLCDRLHRWPSGSAVLLIPKDPHSSLPLPQLVQVQTLAARRHTEVSLVIEGRTTQLSVRSVATRP